MAGRTDSSWGNYRTKVRRAEYKEFCLLIVYMMLSVVFNNYNKEQSQM